MKRLLSQAILISLMYFNASAQNSDIKPYHDKFELAKDILNAIQKKDIHKIEAIAHSLTMPYHLYIKNILPTYKEDSNAVDFPDNEIYPTSLYITDSSIYNKYASHFYYGNLLQSFLNEQDNNIAYGSNIYLVFDKEDNVINDDVHSNYIALLFDNKDFVKVINLEALTTFNNTLYSMRQAQYHSYSKNKLPGYLREKMPESVNVYKLISGEFKKHTNDILLFDNIDYTNLETEAIIFKADDEKVQQSIIKIKSEDGDISDNVPTSMMDADIFDRAEIMPSFQNGAKGLTKYLKENLRYPKTAVKNKVEGKVWVKFIVEKDGSISNPVILKTTVGSECTDEALRLVNKMPKWWPGKQNGKTVSVYYILPITFSLKD